MSTPIPKTLLITDLDNTLFDWVEIWYQSFSAMLDTLVATSKMPRSQLVKEIKSVHQLHGTSEYAFLIEELPSLQNHSDPEGTRRTYQKAVQAFRDAREQTLEVYPGVVDTLTGIAAAGGTIVGYTESMAYYTSYRISRLGLDGLLHYIYSPADHDIPANLNRDREELFQSEYKSLERTVHRNTPAGEVKPNPQILQDIVSDMGVSQSDAVYVGDSLFKDVAMAQHAGVDDVLAAYGEAHTRESYELLREVTHWTDEQVATERKLTRDEVTPSIVLENGFSELLGHFVFATGKKDERKD